MNLINLTTSEYPASLYQVRQTNPNVSFPATPTDEDLLPFGYANVTPTSQPTDYDPRTQRIEEVTPEPDADGIYQQQWAIRNATTEEIAAYDEANKPAPDWVAFKLLSQGSPEFKGIITQALVSDPVNALGLQTELNEVIRGADSRPFYAALSSVFNSVQPDPAIIRSFAAAARLMNLPEEFVSMLLDLVPAEAPVNS
jgi:hypothetical protein